MKQKRQYVINGLLSSADELEYTKRGSKNL